MGKARNWTKEERERFETEWGLYSIPTMAKRFGRTIDAIKNKQQRWNLPDLIHATEYITLNELIEQFGLNYGYDVPRLKAMGFPIRYKLVVTKRVAMVDLEEFWIFAERNAYFFDFSRLEENIFGVEPEWVKAKRKTDLQRKLMIQPHNAKWSSGEDQMLITLVNQFKYTATEIGARLHRSEGAVQRRLLDLGIKARPLKADNHIKWTKEEYRILGEGIKVGKSYAVLSLEIGKSEKAIRGKVFTAYLTENMNKARKMMGNGAFGDNAPPRCLKHKNVMSYDEKQLMKGDLSYLAGLLVLRMKQLSGAGDGYEEYWQKDMCMNWDDVQGCTKGERNCDECSSFERIKPQNCKRCGKTFFSRKETLVCNECS
ncbi:MAG: hypothetical protein E7591_00845 [Ruminococcaceae bacterium]|nr:hypothetical protein [Oscillospiraceae bacterium]